MEPWNWVMRWLEIVDPAVIADLLERFFLPRWLHCLSEWLTQAVESRNRHASSTGQIFSEIGAWYSGWKGQIPPELTDYPSIKDALTKALSFMECAMRGIAPVSVFHFFSFTKSLCGPFEHGQCLATLGHPVVRKSTKFPNSSRSPQQQCCTPSTVCAFGTTPTDKFEGAGGADGSSERLPLPSHCKSLPRGQASISPRGPAGLFRPQCRLLLQLI